MQLRKKILSYFLLASYLLIVLHHSVNHSHDAELSSTSISDSHQHEDFKTDHHEHRFHVGILHFLGHLFEGVNHLDDLSDEHITIIQKTSTKKVADHNSTVNFYTSGDNIMVFSVDAESLPDPPPYHLSLLPSLQRPNTPLRGPPAIG